MQKASGHSRLLRCLFKRRCLVTCIVLAVLAHAQDPFSVQQFLDVLKKQHLPRAMLVQRILSSPFKAGL